MEPPLAQPKEGLVQRIVGVAIALLLILLAIFTGIYFNQLSNPYVREVLALPGDGRRGEQMFQVNCAGCHGRQGRGNVGPSLQGISHRKSQIGLINQVIAGKTPPMPQFQPTPQEMADLLSYLESI